MRILKALQLRPVRLLWSGQVLSAVGDEVYGIAVVWFAARLIGLDAGLVSAIQAGAIFLFSLVGGLFADHRDHRKIMIAADLVRGTAVLGLPISGFLFGLSLWALIPVAVVVSSLSAFFHPALAAFLPTLTRDRALLQASSGLMETTSRFARVIGPGLVGLMSQTIPVLHYFTVDALSFFASAWAISRIDATPAPTEPLARVASVRASLDEGSRLSKRSPTIRYFLVSGGIVGAAWLFIFPLGITLLVRERLSMDVGAVGLVILGYGIGNLTSNLIWSNVLIQHPQRVAFAGRLLAGTGFAALAFCHTLPQMMLACALAATGGPMTDLGLINLIQERFKISEIAKVHRFGMVLSYGCLLVGLLASPYLFKTFSVPIVVLGCAAAIFALGLAGLLRFWRSPDR